MIDVFAAGRAIFFERNFFRHRFTILGARIIFSLTSRTFKRNDISHKHSPFKSAHGRDRTGDVILTKDVLYQLSYMGASKISNSGEGWI